jgi:hypothetical protein
MMAAARRAHRTNKMRISRAVSTADISSEPRQPTRFE